MVGGARGRVCNLKCRFIFKQSGNWKMYTHHINFDAFSYHAVKISWWFDAHLRFLAKMSRWPWRPTRYAYSIMHLHSLLYSVNMPSTHSLQVVEGQVLKTNGKEHCFLSLAKLPRSAILNNFVNKIITTIQKSLKLLLYLRNRPENGATLSKFVYNTCSTCYTIFFSNRSKSCRFLLKLTFYLFIMNVRGE